MEVMVGGQKINRRYPKGITIKTNIDPLKKTTHMKVQCKEIITKIGSMFYNNCKKALCPDDNKKCETRYPCNKYLRYCRNSLFYKIKRNFYSSTNESVIERNQDVMYREIKKFEDDYFIVKGII